MGPFLLRPPHKVTHSLMPGAAAGQGQSGRLLKRGTSLPGPGQVSSGFVECKLEILTRKSEITSVCNMTSAFRGSLATDCVTVVQSGSSGDPREASEPTHAAAATAEPARELGHTLRIVLC